MEKNKALTEVLAWHGSKHVLLPHCCEGHVLVRVISEAFAHRNMITGLIEVEYGYHCAKCKQVLLPVGEPTPVEAKKKANAFTLIELMICVAIVVIFGSIFLRWFNGCKVNTESGTMVGTVVQVSQSGSEYTANVALEGLTSAPIYLRTTDKKVGSKLIGLTGKRVKVAYVKRWGGHVPMKVDETWAGPVAPEK